MAVAFDVSKIFKFCFQILKAKRILFRQYPFRFSKFSSPDTVHCAKTVKINFFENGAPLYNYDVIEKKIFSKMLPYVISTYSENFKIISFLVEKIFKSIDLKKSNLFPYINWGPFLKVLTSSNLEGLSKKFFLENGVK